MEKLTRVNEVFIEESFNASVEKVFSAWTDPAKLMQWYAPEGCTISFKKIDIKTDPTRIRPSDAPVLLGTYKKFNKVTGWEPKIPFEKTLADLLDYWRNRL